METNKNSAEKFDKTFGKVFLHFRKSKNFTQIQASNGIITTSQLSKFENGETMPAFDKIYGMLKNINVTLFEFTDAHNRFIENPDVLLYGTDISNAFLNQDIKKLEKLLSEIKNKIGLFPHCKKYQIDQWHTEVIISLIDSNRPVSDINKMRLKNYIDNLNEWNLYDIQLLGHCISIFSEDSLEKVIRKMLTDIQATNKFHFVEQAVFQTVLNAIDISLSRKKFEAAKKFISHLKHWKIHEYFMYEKFTLKYVEARLSYETGKKSSLDIMKQCKELALFCDCTATATMIEKEIQELRT